MCVDCVYSRVAHVPRVSDYHTEIITFYMEENGGYSGTGPIRRTDQAMSSKLEATF